jgi:hypothetical protein
MERSKASREDLPATLRVGPPRYTKCFGWGCGRRRDARAHRRFCVRPVWYAEGVIELSPRVKGLRNPWVNPQKARRSARAAKSFGLAARVQCLTRYYALVLGPSQALRLLRNYDSAEVLAEVPFSWHWHQRYDFTLQVVGTLVSGSLNGDELIRYNDPETPLRDGGIALIFEEGLIMTDEVSVTARNAE